MFRGKYFITPHAVKRYIERINKQATYEVALDEIIDSVMLSRSKLIVSENPHIYYWPIDTIQKFVAVVKNDKILSILTYKKYYTLQNNEIRKKWKYSDSIYLRLNYKRMTYKNMIESFIHGQSVNNISYHVRKLGLSKVPNWNPYECIVSLHYPNETGELFTNRTKTALKVKKCRLIKSLSN